MGNSSGSGKGGSSGSSLGGGVNLTGGGAGLPFNFGPSPFDLSSIMSALGDMTQAVTNRYQQLGLGGSTMESQDLAGVQKTGDAAIGQEQTTAVSDPAINTSLQPSINSLIGVSGAQSANQAATTANQNLLTSLSSLANQANTSSQFSSGVNDIFNNLPSDTFSGA